MKIQLTNKTQFRDDDLLAIMRAACESAGVALKILKLTVSVSRSDRVSGFAYYPRGPRGFTTMLRAALRIPGPKHLTADTVTRVARVALHEAMHLAGARHKDMTEEQRYCRMPVPWSADLQLRVKDAPPVVPREERMAAARGDRLEHAQKMLAKAQTRLKRASTIEKKWKRRVGALSR